MLALVGGCGLLGGGSLAPTAKKYYDFKVGRNVSQRFSSFTNPAYRENIGSENLQYLDHQLGSSKANTRFQPIKLEDIAVSVEGKFGLSKANPKLGGTYSRMSQVRWIKFGKHWYLYLDTAAEISAYGEFPDSLPPPQFLPEPTAEE